MNLTREGAPPARFAAGRWLNIASADPRSLGLLRIVLGLLLVGDLGLRFRQAGELYSNEGVLTNHFALFRPVAGRQFSLLLALSSPRDVGAALVLTLFVYVAFTVGYRTRLFHALSFVLLTSLHSRNLLAELPSDVPFHLLLAWSFFLPLGSRFSVDAVLDSLRRHQEHVPSDLERRRALPERIVSLAVLGIVLQLSVIHLAAGLWPAGETWRDGTALYYALHQRTWVTHLGAWVGEHVPFRLLTAGYRGAQVIVGCLVLLPFQWARRAGALSLVLLHLGCALLWSIGPYDWVLLGMAVFLITTRDWDRLRDWYRRRKEPLTVYFDADCGVCFATVRLLARLDSLSRLAFSAAASESAPAEVRARAGETASVEVMTSGQIEVKSRAFARILRSLPLLAPAGWTLSAPGIRWLADRAYDQFAPRRAAASVWLGHAACGVLRESAATAFLPSRGFFTRASRATRECAAGVFLLLAVAALALGIDDSTSVPAPGLRATLTAFISYPRLFQVLAPGLPDASRSEGVLLVEAVTVRGSPIDPLGDSLATVPSRGPASGPAEHVPRGPLFRAYFARVSQPRYAAYLDGLRDYVAHRSDGRPGDDRLLRFTISWAETPIQAPDHELRADMSDTLASRRRLIGHP